jgi:uncharacterized repeat protein (TIGR01451 family)
MSKIIKIFALIFSLLATLPQMAFADYVGELETTKFFDTATVALIKSQLPGGLKAGQEISYIIQFTPTDNGAQIAGGGYLTEYVPANMQVVNAQFVQINADGSYTQIDPPTPAALTAAYMPMYSDTGIFYSTDSRTQMYTSPTSSSITSGNGYKNLGPGCNGISLPSTSHNAWDNNMVQAFSGAGSMKNDGNNTTCTAPAITNYSSTGKGGLSPVAGPDAYLTKDYTGAVGPWNRVYYQGSMKATGTGVPGINAGTCVGGAITYAGWNMDYGGTNPLPLPAATNAVRFAAGKVAVGQLFSVRITLKLLADMPSSGIINNAEVFGGDASLDVGNAASFPSNWNQWRYFCPAVATANSNFLLLKSLVGECSGTNCTPTAVTAGVVSNAANLKLRYQIQYLNTGTVAASNVVITDTFASGAAYVTGSATRLSDGTSVTTTKAGNPVVLTFPTIVTLASGAGDTFQYDVNFASAQADGTALINTAKLTSGTSSVTSRAIATVSSQANLWIGKTVSTSTAVTGSTVTYTISIPNNGGTSATRIVVNDYLPSNGGTTVNDRFSFVSLTGANITTAAGVTSAITPTVISGSVATVAPYTGHNREQVTFTLPTATAIPIGGKLTISFTAKVGANIPASTTVPYTNDANVFYAGGPGGTGANSSLSETIGASPVFVTSALALAKKVNCVYTPSTSTTCAPYVSGAIATGSKIKYQLDYQNKSAATLSSVVLTDTLPANTSFAANSASTSAQPVTSGQVVTFTIGTLAPSATGTITFDADASAVTTGTDITNVAKMTATGNTGGVTSSVTSSIRDQVLHIDKIASSTSVQVGGTVTYTVTVTNVSSASTATAIKLYDELPYDTTATAVGTSTRFNYAAAGAFTAPANPSNIVSVTPSTMVPPTFSGYTGLSNRQEVLWDFGATPKLMPGASFSFSYTVTVGSAIAAGATQYSSDIQVSYSSSTTTGGVTTTIAMTDSGYGVAPVTIGGLDHIEIDHTGVGLTCTAPTVTVKACANTACSSLYTSGVTVLLSPSGTSVSVGASGSATATILQSTASTVTLGASTITPAATTATCLNTTINTTSCSFTYADAGFVITVPNRDAGVNNTDVTVQAVKKGLTANSCVAAFASTTQPVSMYSTYVNPATGTNVVKVNNTAVNTSAPGTALNLAFDATGTATIPLSYIDVGQLTLNATGTALNGVGMISTGGTFVVKPGGFLLSVIQQTASPNLVNPMATTAAGNKFVKAGEQFSVTVTATTCASGVTNCVLASTATPNFGNETTPESVSLTSTLVTGLNLTNNPALACTVCFGTFTNGIATGTDFSWPEVGIISITPSLKSGSYLGVAGFTTTGTVSANVGRFYPDHFNTALVASANAPIGCATGSCPLLYNGMVYSGQPFSVTVSAMNSSDSVATNYNTTSGFAKTVTLGAYGGLGLATSPAGAGALGITSETAFGLGTLTELNEKYTFTTAPTTPTNIYIRASDPDGATSLRTTALNSIEGGVAVVSGRTKISNANGSELLPLQMNATVQFYNAAGSWVTSTTDSLSSFSTVSNLLASILTPPATSMTAGLISAKGAGIVTMSGGTAKFTLNAPGVSGKASISLSAPSYLPSTAGIATFGIFPGRKEIIFMRENY